MEELNSRNLLMVFAAASVVLLALNLVLTIPLYSGIVRQSAFASTSPNTSAKSGSGSEALSADVQNSEKTKTITLNGIGVASTKPDRAIFSLSVVTQAKTAGEAQAENAGRMDAVVKALKVAGIADDDMKTTGYSLQAIWFYPKEGEPYVSGYSCTNTIEVTVKDLGKVGEVMDAGVAAGANQLSSISFTISDEAMKELELRALSEAVKDAKVKASTIAEAAGLELLLPMSISLGGGYYPPSRSSFSEASSGAKTPVLAPDKISITMTVTVVYEFR